MRFFSLPIFEMAILEKFMHQVKPFSVPVIAEIMILRTAGIEIFADLVKGLKDLCQGVHVITPGGEG
jgi:methylenetetrahydrofolate reductase (NADPH)